VPQENEIVARLGELIAQLTELVARGDREDRLLDRLDRMLVAIERAGGMNERLANSVLVGSKSTQNVADGLTKTIYEIRQTVEAVRQGTAAAVQGTARWDAIAVAVDSLSKQLGLSTSLIAAGQQVVAAKVDNVHDDITGQHRTVDPSDDSGKHRSMGWVAWTVRAVSAASTGTKVIAALGLIDWILHLVFAVLPKPH